MRTSYLNNWYQKSTLLVLTCYSICAADPQALPLASVAKINIHEDRFHTGEQESSRLGRTRWIGAKDTARRNLGAGQQDHTAAGTSLSPRQSGHY